MERIVRESENMLMYGRAADCFNESLPIGNGRLGACVYAGVKTEKFSINEDTLWTGYPKNIAEKDCSSVFYEVQRLALAGELQEASHLLDNSFGNTLVQIFMPLCNVIVKHGCASSVNEYSRRLMLDEAVHYTDYKCGENRFHRECFVGIPYQVIALKYESEKSGGLSFELSLETELEKTSTHKHGSALCFEGNMPNAKIGYGAYYKKDNEVYSDIPSEQGVRYAAVITAESKGGTVSISDDCISVKDADSAVVYIAVRTNFEGFDKHPQNSKKDCLKDALKDLDAVRGRDYYEIKKECTAVYGEIYGRTTLTFYGENYSGKTTDMRLKDLANGKKDNSLYALLFNYSKYLLISSSYKDSQPANLQGIWNEQLTPPWQCNFTLNINTEMNYWHALPCGLFECYEPLVKMVEELAVSGKKTAEKFYGKHGWTCHHNTDLWRETYPVTNRVTGSNRWGYWPMSSGWLSVMLWNYYTYTLDAEYLKKIYPVIESAAHFYKEMLVERDGKLIFAPSTSPENSYIDEHGEKCTLDLSTAMSQEIIYSLFDSVDKAQTALNINGDYGELLERLKRWDIQEDGRICEWHTMHRDAEEHHRHISHLYGLFPADIFNDKEKAAAAKVLEERGDLGTGWSLAWKINLWAKLRNGERALKLLNNQLNPVDVFCVSPEFPGGSYPNLLCAHPPFQIDGNFGAASGILQMLADVNKSGEITLLPALPKSWDKGELNGLRIPGKKILSFSWENGKVKNEKTVSQI